MATVTLSGLWIHDAADPTTDWRRFRIVTAMSAPEVADGEVQQYGRRRVVRRRPGHRRELNVTFRLERGRVDLEWLRSKVGRKMLFRDFAGNVVWGVYWTLPTDEVPGARTVDVTLTVDPVTAPVPLLSDGDV